MLRFLSIQNLAVIETVEVEFQPGLNVLTGETGAGKSILVEAVGLLVGGRASADLVRTGAESAVVQAIFEDPAGRELILRREVSAQGRSRGFIDGVLATSAAMRDAASGLVELHGQHEHHVLLDPAAHVDLVDQFGGHQALRDDVAGAFSAFEAARADLDRSRMDDREKAARTDLLSFQLKEIGRVNPRTGEDEELGARRQVLANADRLHRLCMEAYVALYEGDRAVLSELGAVWRRVSELASLDPSFGSFDDARHGIKSQLEDLALFLRSYAASLDTSPERLQEMEDRLAAIERLTRRYGPTLQDVIARHAEAAAELSKLESAGAHAAELSARYDEARAAYVAAARTLSTARRRSATRLATELERLVAGLAMERARCEMRFESGEMPEALWSGRGIDRGEWYISPNQGEDLRPLARIASGGELSRIMLAVRTLAAADVPGKTLIFDEVDAGIGGRVADVVGARLKQLAAQGQVLCITHLPQIASYGTTHFRIAKSVRAGRTITEVEILAGEDRVEELSRMMGGRAVSNQVRAGARELLASRVLSTEAKGEHTAKGESESHRGAKGESETTKAKTKGKSRG